MYAVFQTGGKQYRATTGDVVRVELLTGELGTQVSFGEVLFCSKGAAENAQVWIGKPLLAQALVNGEIVGQGRGDKIVTVKKKRRKKYQRTIGHRQFYTEVLIVGVSNGGSEKVTLSDADKKARMAKYTTNLAPKGQAFTQPKSVLKGLEKAAGASTEGAAEGKKAKAAPKKATAKKTKKA